MFQAIHTDDFVEKVIAKCTGSSYPAINSSDLAEISVAIPKPIEQHKIADCLASLDEPYHLSVLS
ncbi:MAG: restriction endonuclease subunit S [Candidatus Competibacteraceae bacterium]|nr:restriction endonuclease subunit S [Candidatus Competibacteraceae bacterium]